MITYDPDRAPGPYPWDLDPPEREPYDWEAEYDALWDEHNERTKIRDGEQDYDTPYLKGELSVDEVFAFVRACRSRPEVWTYMKPFIEEGSEFGERPPGDEIERSHWIGLFRYWYNLKHHPFAHPFIFRAAQHLMVHHLMGRMPDLFGEEARRYLLKGSHWITETAE